jgi:peptidoglycan/xylan/chitin deacetylase (PgdA/CDA1 family)
MIHSIERKPIIFLNLFRSEIVKKICAVCVAILLVFSSLVLWLKSHRSPQVFGKCVHRFETSEKVVALTFDDGPSEYTRGVLDALQKANVKATFFLLGKNVEKHPELVRQIFQEGHEIGNHSWSHQPLIFQWPSFIKEEIRRTDQAIRDCGYQGPIHFRAPYGRKLFVLPWILSKTGRAHILFDVIPDDWANPGTSVIVDRIVKQVKPGSIILCHDGCGDEVSNDRSQTVEATEPAIRVLKNAGYRFTTVSELLTIEKES